MAFHLLFTEDMTRCLLEDLQDRKERGDMITYLLEAAEGHPPPPHENVAPHLVGVLKVFRRQIETLRRTYEEKTAADTERKRRHRAEKRGEPPPVPPVPPVPQDTQDNAGHHAVPPVPRRREEKGREENLNRSYRSDDRSERSETRTDGTNARSDKRFFSSEEIFDPRNNPVDLALDLCNETNRGMAAAGYIKQLNRIGDTAFREIVNQHSSELKAQEEPRNRGAALMAKMKKCPDCEAERAYDPAEDDPAEVSRLSAASLASAAKNSKNSQNSDFSPEP